jgi:NADH-ubiquinone oxidoreductase chain 2
MLTNTINHHKKNIDLIFINRLTILTLLVSILLSFNTLYFQSIGKGITIYNDLFQITLQSQMIEIFLLFIGISILSGWPKIVLSNLFSNTNTLQSFQNKEETMTANDSSDRSDQYSLIALFSILGGSLLMSSFDLLSMYLSIELQSFALYILATLNKDKLSAASAGLKYFLLGGLSSCFILLGSAIIYSYTGLTQFEQINALISIPNQVQGLNAFNSLYTAAPDLWGTEQSYSPYVNKAFTIGFIILMVGFLFKISAAPFYQWAPDVYDGTPTIVTVWLTIVAKLTILIFMVELVDMAYGLSNTYDAIKNNLISASSYVSFIGEMSKGHQEDTSNIIKNLLLICSLLSLIIGTIGGLSQIKIKRLLAFSSVSHVGFLLLALGVYTQKSIDAFIFYIIQYSITSLNIFLIILAFGYFVNNYNARDNKETDLNYLYELKELMIGNPLLSFSFAICLFSMAGIPPLIGFFSKQFILFSSIENGNFFLSITAILVSVISASYYLKLIKISFFEKNQSTSLDNTTILLAKGTNEIVMSSQIKEGNSQMINLSLQQTHSLIISIITFIMLLFFLKPTLILNGTTLIALTFFNL